MPKTPHRWLLVLALASLACVACSKARPLANDVRWCASWQDEVESIAAATCAECHSGDTPAGDYDLTSYLGAAGAGTDDVPNVLAGDPASLLLATLEDPAAEAHHRVDADVLASLRDWIVGCDASYFRSRIHPGGILDVRSDDFHGALLRGLDYRFEVCAQCHGESFDGGLSGVACTRCHTDGPTACNVCHGSSVNPAPPRGRRGERSTGDVAVGAHQTHVAGGPLGKVWACSECHVVPESWDDIGHLKLEDGSLDPSPAEVTFGPFAGTTRDPADRRGDPTWNHDSATCAEIYCHGDVLGDSTAANTIPTWTAVGSGEADCGSCHGLPPSGHASDQCSRCHGAVVDASRTIINPDLHIDGRVELGDGTGDCSGCHGSPASPAPPPDLSGGVDTSAVGVGAHQSHLGASRLRGPVPCTACHVVPTEVVTPGHLDSDLPAEVFPSDPRFSSLATTDGASPAWDRAAERCSGVYCHGGGSRLAADTSAGLNRTPQWTSPGTGEAACGACHGLPPQNGVHPSPFAVTECVRCHPGTVDPLGAIVITGSPGAETSLHINGTVDLGDGTGACNTCHGGADGPAPPPDLSGSTSPASLGVGSHSSHVRRGRLRGPVACDACHVMPTEVRSPGHLDSDLPAEVFPPGLGSLASADGAAPIWARATMRCTGVYCHGNGIGLADDTSPGLYRTPDWTSPGGSEAACGNCHGLPPQNGVHPGPFFITQCGTCHTRTIDSGGAIIITGAPGAETSFHINGVVDVP